MAYTITDLSAKHVENVGTQHKYDIWTGVVALSGGAKDVTLPGVKHIVTAFASSQTSNAARVSATSGSTLSLSGTGSDVVMWLALVQK